VIITLLILPIVRRKPATRQRQVYAVISSTISRSKALHAILPHAVRAAREPEPTLRVTRHIAGMTLLLALGIMRNFVWWHNHGHRILWRMWFRGVGGHAVDFTVGMGCAFFGVGAPGLNVPEAVLSADEDGGGVGVALEGAGLAGGGREEVGFLDAAGFAAGRGADVVAGFVFGTCGLKDPVVVGGEGLNFVIFAAVGCGVAVGFGGIVDDRSAEAAGDRRA
jgi:hypothetical protein